MVRTLILALALLGAGTAIAHAKRTVTSVPPAEIPRFTGRWELDLTRSTIWKKATRPLWRVDNIQLEGADMHWSWHAEEPKGPWKAGVHLATDGRETRNVIAGHGSKSHGWWRGDTLNFVTRGRAYFLPYRLDDHIWLGEDGQEMNVVRKFRMATLNEDEHWVFRRLEAEPERSKDIPAGAGGR